MSDINISGVPNLGIPAMGGFNQGGYFADPSAGLNNAYASQASNQRYFGNQAQTLAAAQMPQSQLYGPQGFGGATAQAAATGAAYGRGTGGFNAGKQVAPIPGSGQKAGGGSVFDTGAPPFQSYGLPGGGGMGAFSPSPNYPGGSSSTFVSRFGAAPPVNSYLQPPSYQGALDAVNQFQGVGTNANLGRSGLPQGAAPPIMNQGDDEPGTPPSSIQPGHNVGSSNPFTSGAAPFPFAGGYQGSMRDRIASAITGPLVQSPQTPTPTPTPTQSQMNNATDMLRAGRGWTIAQQAPPPSGYAPINQAISSIGSVSRPDMFDNYKLPQAPMSSMFAPSGYGGR